jgi:hypothetical protein
VEREERSESGISSAADSVLAADSGADPSSNPPQAASPPEDEGVICDASPADDGRTEDAVSDGQQPLLADRTAPSDGLFGSPRGRSSANDDDPSPVLRSSLSDGLTLSSVPLPMSRSSQGLGAMPPLLPNFQRGILAAYPTADRLLQQALRRVLGIANP